MTTLIDATTGLPKTPPEVPPEATSYADRNGDVVYDVDDPIHPRRWRYRKGKLLRFMVYEYYDWTHQRTSKAAGMTKGSVERSVRPLAEFRE